MIAEVAVSNTEYERPRSVTLVLHLPNQPAQINFEMNTPLVDQRAVDSGVHDAVVCVFQVLGAVDVCKLRRKLKAHLRKHRWARAHARSR